MALTYHLADRCILIVAAGTVDYEEGLSVFADALTAARASAVDQWDILFDISTSEEDRSEQELRDLSAFVAEHKDILSGRCAIVAADPLHFGLSRMFQAYCASLEVSVEVFDEIAAARSWLETAD